LLAEKRKTTRFLSSRRKGGKNLFDAKRGMHLGTLKILISSVGNSGREGRAVRLSCWATKRTGGHAGVLDSKEGWPDRGLEKVHDQKALNKRRRE